MAHAALFFLLAVLASMGAAYFTHNRRYGMVSLMVAAATITAAATVMAMPTS